MEKKDPFKVDFKSGENKAADDKTESVKSTEKKEIATSNLSRREKRKQRKREKELKRIEERNFEKEAGLIGVKKTSLTLGIIGFILSTIPILLLVGAMILFLICGITTVALFLLCLVGFLLIIPFYLAGGGSIENYFGFALAPAEFASKILNTVTGFTGWFSVVCAAGGLIMEIISLILLFVSYKALCKRNRIKRMVFIIFAILFTLIVLIVSVNGVKV